MSTDGSGAPAIPQGRPVRSSGLHLSRRRTPFMIIAAIQTLAAGLCLVFALVDSDVGISPTDLVMLAGILAVAAAITLWVLPLLPNGTGVDVALGIGYLLAAGAAVMTPTAEGQVLIGLGLASYAVFAAYFLPKARLLASLFLAFTCLGIAENINPRMSSPAVFWMIVAVITGLAILVSNLVHRLRDLALHDELTGVLNRRGLDVLGPALVSACARSNVPLTVGLVDLDRFKLYNDTHGHLAGDSLLRDTAERWSGQLRDSDLAARFGGDEFAVVLVDSRLPDAHTLEARVRAVRPDARDLPTAGWTVGWAEVRSGEGLYAALGRADASLLDAKRSRGAHRA